MTRPITTLLVDDSPAFLSSAARFIAGTRNLAVVGCAASGEEAQAQALRLQPDLVVIDLAMPQMNGLEATQRLKAQNPNLRVILMTLHDSTEHRAAARAARADGFVVKSRLCDDLPPLIRSLWAQKQSAPRPPDTAQRSGQAQELTMTTRTHYQILGIPEQGTMAEVHARYRELALKYHPDVVQDNALGRPDFLRINEAYRVLSRPEQRAAYDRKLQAARSFEQRTAAPAPVALAMAPAAVPVAPEPPRRASAESSLARSAAMNSLLTEAEGDALVEMQRPEEAAEAYRRAMAIRPSPQLRDKLFRLTKGPDAEKPGATINSLPEQDGLLDRLLRRWKQRPSFSVPDHS